MLSEAERNWVLDLLKNLEADDLTDLAKTCTNGVIRTSNVQDSINAILLHSADLNSLLMRKKITRSVLFKYLHSKNISFPGNLEKSALLEMIIKYWHNKAEEESSRNQNQITQDPSYFTLKNLGIKFLEWFYSRLNVMILEKNNLASSNSDGLDCLKEEDFWSDVNLSIGLTQGKGMILSEYTSHGSKESLSLLNNICKEHSLMFSPNLSDDGTKTASEPHGLVLVMCCGTLHSADMHNCVGVFEQTFGLIKDPTIEDNWKIKFSKLILRSQTVTELPALLSEETES